jgi:bifunctional aspartokinase / homoserine dehydrogenase 1
LNNSLVMKFGGTSMGSAERIEIAARICREQKTARPVVAVVSAMSKITDLLLAAMRRAEAGDENGLALDIRKLRDRHEETCQTLLAADRRDAVRNQMYRLIGDFERIARGMLMLGERPPRSVDEALATGEKLSALLMAAFLESQGVHAVAVDAAGVIVTDALFGGATPLMEPTRARAVAILRPMLEEGVLPVVTGFNGATADGRPTTLGRGGSDFSASILAAALDAAELWIWTDVDGIMSADPRLVANARVLEEVTYSEAAELAYNGAKVLHPRTLAPLVERKIPVWSKNSFDLAKPGTKIVPALRDSRAARAVTSMADVALVSMESTSPELTGTRLMARALDTLTLCNTEVLIFTSSSYRQNFCFLVRNEELNRAVERLEESLALELAHGYVQPIQIDRHVGLLAIVGEGMRGTPGLAGRIFTAISRENVNIIAIAQGSSELTIAVVVHRDGLEAAVRAVHEECGLAEASRGSVV